MVSVEQGMRYQHSYAVAAVAAAADNVYALIPMYTVLGDDLQNTILLRFVGIRDRIQASWLGIRARLRVS